MIPCKRLKNELFEAMMFVLQCITPKNNDSTRTFIES